MQPPDHLVQLRPAVVGDAVATLDLFRALDSETAHHDWAVSKAKHKIELTVMENNPDAIGLYKAQGFIQEGIKRDSVRLGNSFVNEIIMGKIL